MAGRGRPKHDDLLTPAEWRVTEAVRHGRSNRDIAVALGVSIDAVKFHVANILSKLGISSRLDLRRWNGVDADTTRRRGKVAGESEGWRLRQVARSTGDITKARDFYGGTLGLPELFQVGNMCFYDLDGTRLMVAEDGKAGPESILYIETIDIHERQKVLEARGVRFSHAAHRVHRHADGSEEWMAFFEDNDGRPMALASLIRGEPSGP
ncbi:MAG TPA: LuxR C-terminal-related transcriptional regulator [Sphingomicrobium sp.]|nr:LuxR C-terminal-related transcriptional regulator [Sphingomicrobium sp.]